MDDRERSLETAFYLRTFLLDLRSTELHNRRFAASVLRDYADMRTLRALIDALEDSDEEVRQVASEGVEAIFNASSAPESLSLLVISEAMDRAGRIYEQRPEPATLRPIVIAITSQNDSLADCTRNMLRSFSSTNLLALVCEQTGPLSTASWDALRWQYQQLQRPTVQLFLHTALCSEDELLVKSVYDLLNALPSSLQVADGSDLLNLVVSDKEVLADLGWSALNALLSQPQAPSAIYESAQRWVQDHFSDWLRLCSTEDTVKQRVVAMLRQSYAFRQGWRGIGSESLRICAGLTQASGPLAESAWEILTYSFTEELAWRHRNESQHSWERGIETALELAVGRFPGNQHAAKDLLIRNPSCLGMIEDLDLLSEITKIENRNLSDVAWQQLKHLIASGTVQPGNGFWESLITEAGPMLVPGLLLLLGLPNRDSSAEALAWKILLGAKDESVPEVLVPLLSHERKDVREQAFEVLCSHNVPPDILLQLLMCVETGRNKSQLNRLVNQYGLDLCWNTLIAQFARRGASKPFEAHQGVLFGWMVALDEKQALDLLFKGMVADTKAERNAAFAVLLSTCRSMSQSQNILDVQGALLVIAATVPEVPVTSNVKQWHEEFKAALDPMTREEQLCHLVLLSRYGTPAQIVMTLSKGLELSPEDRRGSTAILLRRCSVWKKEARLTVTVQKVESYLMDMRAAGAHPTPVKELLQGADAPTETKPAPTSGFWQRFGRD